MRNDVPMLLAEIPYPRELVRRNFYAFEGIDGAGKSTQIALIAGELRKAGHLVAVLCEPTRSPIGERIRRALYSKGDRVDLDALFIEDRKYDVTHNIEPLLRQNNIVLMDRYIYSHGSYQGIDHRWQSIVERNLRHRFPLPEITFLFRISPEAAVQRIAQSRAKRSRFEKKKLLEQIQQNYFEIAQWDPLVQIIDAEMPREDITKQILDQIAENRKRKRKNP